MQGTVVEIININKKIAALDQKFDSINGNNSKKFEAAQEKINQAKVYLEQKIDAAMALEVQFSQNRDEMRQVQDLMFRTKTELT